MPDVHARLSPSASARWLTCTASVLATAGKKGEESSYAQEGTLAHRLCELRATTLLRLPGHETYQEDFKEWWGELVAFAPKTFDDTYWEMLGHAENYVRILGETAGDTGEVFLEQRLYTGVEDCWGTSDAVIVFPDRVVVVDFKYGAGLPVSAYWNTQLMLYAAGALEEFDPLGSVDRVDWMIVQPRVREEPSQDGMPASQLRAWVEYIATPAAREALTGEGSRFAPSEKACRFCPLAGTCRARAEHVLRQDFPPPDELTPEEIGDALHRVPAIKDWCRALEETALETAFSGNTRIPGWKVVKSGGQRQIKDQSAAEERLRAAGVDEDDFILPGKLAGFGVLDKLVGGKEKLSEILGSTLGMTEGRESLVSEKDPRPEYRGIDSAREDFA